MIGSGMPMIQSSAPRIMGILHLVVWSERKAGARGICS